MRIADPREIEGVATFTRLPRPPQLRRRWLGGYGAELTWALLTLLLLTWMALLALTLWH